MGRRATLASVLLLSLPTAWAQSGSVRIRVTDVTGNAISGATVSLFNGWNRQIGTSPANDSGEVLWPRLSFGEWRFVVVARGFAPDVFALNICEGGQRMVRTKLQVAPPDRDIDRIIVEAEAILVRLDPMPYCDVLDLHQAPKPKKRN